VHPDYTLIPVEFYTALVAETGLRPVFMGQIGANSYIERLRRAFPDARFIPSRGPLRDFEIIRRSRNVIVSVSTFSWLAAWLSDADRIFLPMTGFYNPAQFPEIDLLPLHDPRYRFYLFPVNYAVPESGAAVPRRVQRGILPRPQSGCAGGGGPRGVQKRVRALCDVRLFRAARSIPSRQSLVRAAVPARRHRGGSGRLRRFPPPLSRGGAREGIRAVASAGSAGEPGRARAAAHRGRAGITSCAWLGATRSRCHKQGDAVPLSSPAVAVFAQDSSSALGKAPSVRVAHGEGVGAQSGISRAQSGVHGANPARG